MTGRQRQAIPGRQCSEAMYEQTWWCRADLVVPACVGPLSPTHGAHREEATRADLQSQLSGPDAVLVAGSGLINFVHPGRKRPV
jgi:hypothetical protein